MKPSTFVRSSLPLLSLWIAACGASDPRPAAPATTVLAATAPPPETTAPPPHDPNAALVSLVCARRDTCALVKEHDAGKDTNGRALSVALFMVALPEPEEEDAATPPGAPVPPSEPEMPTPIEAPHDPGLTFDPHGETFAPASFRSCFGYEYWRIVRQGDLIVEASPIAEICNDGHGAAGVGEDAAIIGDNSFEVATSGGSSWRWWGNKTYSLSPFAVRAEEDGAYWAASVHRAESNVDWETFSGTTTWLSPQCSPDGTMPDSPEPDETAQTYAWVPQVALDFSFTGEGWKTTRLDGCAATIDATDAAGFVISGQASTSTDARLRLVASTTGTLFVEVDDDLISGPSTQPERDDHLEVWIGGELPGWDTRCIDTTTTANVQSWRVRMADGKVTPGFGKPAATSLPVQRAADPRGPVRFRITLPQGQHAVTIAYADRDDGKTIERRIATSHLVDGRAITLGTLSPVEERATCSVKNGTLVHELIPAKLP